jgi:hypothetical protein
MEEEGSWLRAFNRDSGRSSDLMECSRLACRDFDSGITSGLKMWFFCKKGAEKGGFFKKKRGKETALQFLFPV